MLLKENFYKRRNEKAWSLWLLPLVFLSCFVCSAQSFAVMEKIIPFSGNELKILISSGNQPMLKYLATNVLSKPGPFHWQKHPGYMKNLIEQANDKTLLYIAKKAFPFPREGDAELVKALVESGDTEATRREIVEHFQPEQSQMRKDHRGLEQGIVTDRDVSIVQEVLISQRQRPQTLITSESVKALIESVNQAIKRDRDVSTEIGENVFSQRQWNESVNKNKGDSNVSTEEHEREVVRGVVRELGREALMEIVKNTTFNPQTESDADLVRDLIEKAGYISLSLMKRVGDSISSSINSSQEIPAKYETLESFIHVDVLMKVATDILSQPGWEAHPKLLKALIDKAGPRILNKIATDVLSQPHWLGRNPEFIEALIKNGNQRILEVVVKKILSQIEWYGHHELIEALIEKGQGDKNLYVLRGATNFQLLGWIEQYIFKQRYWQTHPRFIEMFEGKEVSNMNNFRERVRARTCS